MGKSPRKGPDPVAGLVARVQEGDNDAFDLIVERYKTRIYNYAVKMVHDPTEAEDIAQEAFIRAYRNLDSFRGTATFQTWMYTITSNLTIDSVRKRRRRENTLSLDCPLEVEDGLLQREQADDRIFLSPSDRLEITELQRSVNREIQRLSPKLRNVVVLYELQGLSYQEIADVLGCPIGTVKSRLYNARILLKAALRKNGLFDELLVSA